MHEIFDAIVVAVKAMSFLEIFAVLFAVASVIYSWKENILVYPTGIAGVLIYVYLCYQSGIFADVLINVFYFIMSVYGWYNWAKKTGSVQLKITKNSLRDNLISLLAVFILWPILYYVLTKYTTSNVPIMDSFTTAIFFLGMWLMAFKKIENWLVLIVGNLVSIPLYWHKELYLSALLYIFLTTIAVLGYLAWRKKLACQSISE